jgi:hypothetical protein
MTGMEGTDVWALAEQRRRIIDLGSKFACAIVNKLFDGASVHAETAIAAASRMAGTFLVRSSAAANGSGPELVGTAVGILGHLGIQLDPKCMPAVDLVARPPKFSVAEVQSLFEDEFQTLKRAFQVGDDDAARAAAVAAALLIREYAADPQAGFAIAAHGFVEGSTSCEAHEIRAPLPVVAQRARRPWYRLW